MLDGQRTPAQVVDLLERRFEGALAEVRNDVVGFATEQVQRRIPSVKA